MGGEFEQTLQSHKDELDRMKRDLQFANERADDASRNKSADTSSLIAKYNRQLTELEDSLKSKQMQIDDLLRKLDDQARDHAEFIEDKEAELSVMQESLDATLQNLNENKLVRPYRLAPTPCFFKLILCFPFSPHSIVYWRGRPGVHRSGRHPYFGSPKGAQPDHR